MDKIIEDFKEEFQIPPYFPDMNLINYYQEGCIQLSGLNPYADFENDAMAQMLLKNYMYYAYNHRVDEFVKNYEQLILQWQMCQEVAE